MVDFPKLMWPRKSEAFSTGNHEISEEEFRDEGVRKSASYLRAMRSPEQYLASFPNSINNKVADLWLFKACLFLPMPVIAALTVLLILSGTISFSNLAHVIEPARSFSQSLPQMCRGQSAAETQVS